MQQCSLCKDGIMLLKLKKYYPLNERSHNNMTVIFTGRMLNTYFNKIIIKMGVILFLINQKKILI